MILYACLYMVNEMNSLVLQTNKQDDQYLITS